MTIRVFLSGQSNALGRGTGGFPWSLIDNRVSVWNNVNPLGAVGTAFVTAEQARLAGTFQDTNRNNLAVWFCDRLAKYAGDDVRMTAVVRGATLIEAWLDGGEPPMLQECINVWSVSQDGPADIFLWHQGEGAVSGDYPQYRANFLQVLANLTAGGVIDSNTVVIVGGLSEDNANRIAFNQDALQFLANENSQIYFAPSSGLSSYDGTHFTGDSLTRFGAERYFRAYLESLGMSTYALVNVGGEPGVAGTGENKILNMDNIIGGYKLRAAPLIITSSGTYTPDPEVRAIRVRGCGGGGGAGGVQGVGGGTGARATSCAGSGASWFEFFVAAPDLAASYSVTIGVAGAGGSAGNNGGVGGLTSITDGSRTASATGGRGGAGMLATSSSSAAAPVGTQGTASLSGFSGIAVANDLASQAYVIDGLTVSTSNPGKTPFGTGGQLVVEGTGAAGNGYGAGGGAVTVGHNSAGGFSGGAGAPGVIIIDEYV